jgi:hypothetical protein
MSFDLHSLEFYKLQEDKKDVCKYIYASLDGSIYDIAHVVHFLYKDIYKVARLKSKLWYVFDGLKWKPSELGPYYELSTKVVDIYNMYIKEEIEKRQTIEDQIELESCNPSENETQILHYKHSLKTTQRIIASFEKICQKLKNVHTKESICKECLYLFYDSEFLSHLDTNKNLICFLNGILDFQNNLLRGGLCTDNISIVINTNFVTPKTKKEKNELSILLEDFQSFCDKITSKRQNKLLFIV